ncbi:MAG: RNA polymerase sigma factor [Sedimentisphaerales bacterium]|jgi:RNA polymerase sigma-70 factor (ECF subfamily)|nr:RNA polymerase sigma factor [Sedimentisphaerales bacterium]HNY79868.1 RNA polymerase sigma factor [Sedimentisphaerales bacterium]HOC64870.1 RNA polymerase sigma factor [Sedimentisphaerales bacterium]HOH65800.1 RNA polymerase sigma factor [Sedimentisphaerales bacterium]HPY49046.1 RNA polymerase sigma factor [Sedimentisphaerales bacterium]
MTEDTQLLERLRRGDKDALRTIYEKYQGTLATLAAGLLDDHATAEDVLQDVMVSLVRSVHRLNIKGDLRAYLATAVANRARDHYRRQPRQKVVALDETLEMASGAEGPLQMVIRDERLQQVRLALEELPYEQREAIVLRLHADMKFRQIARFQSVSIKTALSRYAYGLDKLRSRLNGEAER